MLRVKGPGLSKSNPKRSMITQRNTAMLEKSRWERTPPPPLTPSALAEQKRNTKSFTGAGVPQRITTNLSLH